MGAMQRRKGATAEREVAQLARDHDLKARRTAPMQAQQGAPEADVCLGLPGVSLEVKRRERLSVDQWMREHEARTPSHMIPAVAYRRSHEPWRVCLPLDDFLELVKAKDTA